MAKVHELVFQISGNINSNLKQSFAAMSSNTNKLAKEIQSLDKINLNTSKYTELNKKISSTQTALLKANSAVFPLNKSFQESKNKTNKLHNEFKNAEKKVNDLSLALAKGEGNTKQFKSALAVAKIEAKNAKNAFKESSMETNKLGNKLKSAESESVTLNNALSKQKEKLSEVNKELQKAGINSDNFAKAQEKASIKSDKLTKIADAKNNVNKAWGDVGKKSKSFAKTAAITGAMVALPLKFAIDAESTMADIGKVVDFDNIMERSQFEQQMRKKLGTELPLEFENYGELIASAAGAGIKKEELLDFSEDSAKMSVAFDIEAGEAGEKMAKWRSAFGMDQKEVVDLADKINYLSNNSAATAPAISNIVSRVGALGDIAGISSGQVAAIGTSMVSMGVGEEVGATAIKKLSTSLTKGAAATKTQQKAFARIGLSSEQVNKDMQKDSQKTIMTVLGNIQKLPKEMQTSTLTQMFGEESVQAIAPLLKNLDVLEQQFANVSDEAGKFRGSMQQEFDVRSDTAANQLQLLKNNLKSIGTTIGQILLPYLVKVAEKITDVAQKFQEWSDKNPEMIERIVKLAAGIAAFILVGKGLVLIVSIIQALKYTFELFNLTVAMNPIGLVIVLIIGALLLLWKNWDTVKAGILTGIDFLVEKFNWFKDKVVSHFTKVYEIGQKTGQIIKEAFEKAINWIPEKIDSIARKIGSVKDSVTGFFTGGNKNTIEVGARANGGIVTRPELSWIGEAGYPEAVIPLNNSANAMNLWKYTGQRLGAFNDGNSKPLLKPVSTNSTNSSNQNNINVNFNIEVNGGGDDVQNEVERAIMNASPKVKAMLKQLLLDLENDKKRLSYT